MDIDIIAKHIELIEKHYPGINIVQIGIITLLLGSLRATMGHEYSKATLDNYIHVKHMKPNIRKCLDFIEREVLGIKSSRIDIDRYKMGNKSRYKRKYNKTERR